MGKGGEYYSKNADLYGNEIVDCLIAAACVAGTKKQFSCAGEMYLRAAKMTNAPELFYKAFCAYASSTPTQYNWTPTTARLCTDIYIEQGDYERAAHVQFSYAQFRAKHNVGDYESRAILLEYAVSLSLRANCSLYIQNGRIEIADAWMKAGKYRRAAVCYGNLVALYPRDFRLQNWALYCGLCWIAAEEPANVVRVKILDCKSARNLLRKLRRMETADERRRAIESYKKAKYTGHLTAIFESILELE